MIPQDSFSLTLTHCAVFILILVISIHCMNSSLRLLLSRRRDHDCATPAPSPAATAIVDHYGCLSSAVCLVEQSSLRRNTTVYLRLSISLYNSFYSTSYTFHFQRRPPASSNHFSCYITLESHLSVHISQITHITHDRLYNNK